MDTLTPPAAPAAPSPPTDGAPGGAVDGSPALASPTDRAHVPAPALCPYLVAASGDWRAPAPRKEHRCAAFLPPASLAPEKQARLCLTPAHPTCATYAAARRARAERVGDADASPRVGKWGHARTTALVEDAGGSRALVAGLVADRRTWQLAPAVVLVVAVAALAVSSFRDRQAAISSVPTPSPTTISSPEPTATLGPSAFGTVVETPIATVPATPPPSVPAPTAVPTTAPTPAPSARASYTVVSGDTLSGIAGKFNTTVSAIMTFNGLTSTKLHIGQVLLIP